MSVKSEKIDYHENNTSDILDGIDDEEEDQLND